VQDLDRISLDSNLMAGFAIGCMGLAAFAACMAAVIADDNEVEAACMLFGPMQSMAVVLAVLGADLEVLRSMQLIQDYAESADRPPEYTAALAGIVCFMVSLAFTLAMNCLFCKAVIQDDGYDLGDACKCPPAAGCAMCQSCISIEGCLVWGFLGSEMGLGMYESSHESATVVQAASAYYSGVRLLLLEIPHLIILGIWYSNWGGYFSLNVGIAAAAVSMAVGMMRYCVFFEYYNEDSGFA